MRTILQSETYQRSSLTVEGNREDPKYLSHYAPRRLMAEVLLDSMDQVLGTSTSFTEIAFAGADKQKTDFYNAGTRAIELYDSAVDSYFLKTFGRNPREIVCECERDAEPSMVQVLHLSNGETLNPKLNDPASLPSLAAAEKWDRDEYLDVLFQRSLSRVPTAAERQSLVSVMDEYGEGPNHRDARRRLERFDQRRVHLQPLKRSPMRTPLHLFVVGCLLFFDERFRGQTLSKTWHRFCKHIASGVMPRMMRRADWRWTRTLL